MTADVEAAARLVQGRVLHCIGAGVGNEFCGVELVLGINHDGHVFKVARLVERQLHGMRLAIVMADTAVSPAF